MSALTTLATAALLAVFATPETSVPAPPAPEIKAFASALAIAQTASARCSAVRINEELLAGLRDRFRLKDSDAAAVAAQSRYVSNLLARAIDAAPDVKTWCDTTYALYGPEGTEVPGLITR